jgi:hypothetical protein
VKAKEHIRKKEYLLFHRKDTPVKVRLADNVDAVIAMIERGEIAKSNMEEYRIWKAIISRCTDEKHAKFSDYGGRGITISNEWMDFFTFFRDMGIRPTGLEIDRIDNDKGYNKENCAWTSRIVNLFNQRPRKRKTDLPRGVRTTRQGKFMAVISVGGNSVSAGTFKTIDEAKEAYKVISKEWFGREFKENDKQE